MGLISKKEAAEILGRSERTIGDWIQSGVLKAHMVKKSQLVDSDTVYALKDTEADIDHAIAERKRFYEGLKNELEEMRREEGFGHPAVCQTVKELAGALGVLCESEQYVFSDVIDGRSYEAIGECMTITRERVRQIFQKVLRRTCAAMKSYTQMLNETTELRDAVALLQVEVKEKDKELQLLRQRLELPEPQEPDTEMRRLLRTPLWDMALSVRVVTCLKSCDIETLGDLVQRSKIDILRIRNLGKKSLRELDDLLGKYDLQWGSDIQELIYGKPSTTEIE